jgi:NAD(P)H-hydrate repair Nnr-like enzyme with NAD(P)H-hydrate epimerase domain
MQLIHTNGKQFKLNIFIGESKTNDLVVDAIFGLSVPNCIKLIRTVEMY